MKLAAGEIGEIADANLKKETLDIQVQLKALFEGEEEPRIVYSSIWGHRPIQRNFVFILDQDNKHRPLDVKKYYDVPSLKR